jgi:hypothetical protein
MMRLSFLPVVPQGNQGRVAVASIQTIDAERRFSKPPLLMEDKGCENPSSAWASPRVFCYFRKKGRSAWSSGLISWSRLVQANHSRGDAMSMVANVVVGLIALLHVYILEHGKQTLIIGTEVKMKRISLIVVTLVLFTKGLASAQSNYFQFGDLNQDPVDVSSTWTKLNTTPGTHTFKKSSSSTKIEIHVNSRFGLGVLGGGAYGILIQVRVDDTEPAFQNMGSILMSDTSEFQSIYAVFPKLSVGNHTVSLWARALPSGFATSVTVDPGGWGGKIIVKETD